MKSYLWQLLLLFALVALPQLAGIAVGVWLKRGCRAMLGGCAAASLTFFCALVALFMFLAADAARQSSGPQCGQWMAGFPIILVVGCAFHALLAAVLYGCSRLVRRALKGQTPDSPDENEDTDLSQPPEEKEG